MSEKDNKNKINKKDNNRGSAVVLVIVVLALMGILVSVVLYMSMANFHMKANDRQSKDNFYSAEQVLDEIKVGLQGEASAAIDIAYMNVIQKYELRSSEPNERKREFTILYVNELRKALKSDSLNDDTRYDIEKLKAFVQDQSVLMGNDADFTKSIGAKVEVVDVNSNGIKDDNLMMPYTEALVLKNIRVKYRDSKGYVSMVTTDIRIDIPDISFESSLRIPEIIEYSIVANDQLIANSKTTITGSVYGGRYGITTHPEHGDKSFYFKDSEVVITPNLVTAMNNGTITTDKDTNLWAGGTQAGGLNQEGNLLSGTLNLEGNSYIKDDTTVVGNGSKLTLSGKYMGMGKPDNYVESYAEEGSSIIINGTNADVKLKGLKRLLLPGNTYIGVNDYNDTLRLTPVPTGQPTVVPNIQTNGDVALGESLTAKATQIAYLVPAECIGYVRKNATSKFERVLGTNPVLYSDYASKFLSAEEDNRVEVDFSKAGIDYATKYGAKFRQKYVRTSGGNLTNDTLIYYYMTFNNQNDAAAFFYDYFSENKDRIAEYLEIYVDTLEIDDIERLNVAGNLLKRVPKKDASGKEVTDDLGNVVYTYELVKETKSADDAMGLDYDVELSTYKSVFEGLTTKLVKDASALTPEEKANVDVTNPTSPGIFANLIDMQKFGDLCISTEFAASGIAEFENAVEGVKAVVTNKPTYSISQLNPETSLLITSGDVEVDIPFRGCIISGGSITVNYGTGGDGKQVDISNHKEMIRHVLNMTTPFTINGVQTDVCVMDLFKDGMGIATSDDSDDKAEHIVVEDLITYDNWSKE